MAPQYVPVTLPGGLWYAGERQREAVVRPIVGADEFVCAELIGTQSPAARTTSLLARCVERIGPISEIGPDEVRQLTVGDREALLLHLHRLTFGERLPCLIDCPTINCGERLEIELRVADLLSAPYESAELSTEHVVTVGGEALRVRLRRPTGADQEHAAGLSAQGLDKAVAELVRRCVEVVSGEAAVLAVDVGAALTEPISDLLEELDPQAQLELAVTCPACAVSFGVIFDSATYLFAELADRSRRMYWEMHCLAFHYHWSESEIMALTPRARERHMEMLDLQLASRAAR